MRSACLRALIPVLTALSSLGCGGSSAAGANAASASSAGALPSSPSSAPDAGQATPGPAGTTTTLALPDAGDLQGTKLSEAHRASTTASSAPGGNGPHGHEPGRSVADIRAIVMAHRDEARACYERALPGHPTLEGDLVIQWTIDPKGNVTQVSADASRSAIGEPAVVACVAGVIQKLQFAASPGGYETRSSYPFNFRPHHAGSPAPQN